MNDSIDRISAKNDVRSLTLAACTQSHEFATSYRDQLILEIGTTVTLEVDPARDAMREAVRDEKGFAELKEMEKQ